MASKNEENIANKKIFCLMDTRVLMSLLYRPLSARLEENLLRSAKRPFNVFSEDFEQKLNISQVSLSS